MKLSVVIPTHNKLDSLKLVLESLCLQTCKEFEVLVVNDGGHPATVALVEHFASRLDIKHHWAAQVGRTPRGAATARNVGFRAAQAEHILVVDDDCLCPDDLVAAHAEAALVADLGYVGFRRHVDPQVSSKLTEVQLRDIKRLVPGQGEIRAPARQVDRMEDMSRRNDFSLHQYLWTCHLSFPRTRAWQVGGMWEEMKGSGHEDCEFGLRLMRAGVRFKVLHDPPVYHLDHPQSPLQTANATRNWSLLGQTRHEYAVIVRNGGPISGGGVPGRSRSSSPPATNWSTWSERSKR